MRCARFGLIFAVAVVSSVVVACFAGRAHAALISAAEVESGPLIVIADGGIPGPYDFFWFGGLYGVTESSPATLTAEVGTPGEVTPRDYVASFAYNNLTGEAWLGFELSLDPDGPATFIDLPSVNGLERTWLKEPQAAEFTTPIPANHQFVISMNINVVPGINPFRLTLTPVITPEPITAAFLAAGSLLLTGRVVSRSRTKMAT